MANEYDRKVKDEPAAPDIRENPEMEEYAKKSNDFAPIRDGIELVDEGSYLALSDEPRIEGYLITTLADSIKDIPDEKLLDLFDGLKKKGW